MGTMNHTPTCLFVRVADWIRRDAEGRRDLASLARLDLPRMAADLDVPEAELRRVLPRSADTAVLFTRALAARGVDPNALQADPALLASLVRTCRDCRSTARCRSALAAGDLSDAAHYCGNAIAFARLTRH